MQRWFDQLADKVNQADLYVTPPLILRQTPGGTTLGMTDVSPIRWAYPSVPSSWTPADPPAGWGEVGYTAPPNNGLFMSGSAPMEYWAAIQARPKVDTIPAEITSDPIWIYCPCFGKSFPMKWGPALYGLASSSALLPYIIDPWGTPVALGYPMDDAIGTIKMWGVVDDPPPGWYVCDGTTQTDPWGRDVVLPNFTNKFARGNTAQTTGGSDTHDHWLTSPSAGWPNVAGNAATLEVAGGDNVPAYVGVTFIMRVN